VDRSSIIAIAGKLSFPACLLSQPYNDSRVPCLGEREISSPRRVLKPEFVTAAFCAEPFASADGDCEY
jgi:hypothetical protein